MTFEEWLVELDSSLLRQGSRFEAADISEANLREDYDLGYGPELSAKLFMDYMERKGIKPVRIGRSEVEPKVIGILTSVFEILAWIIGISQLVIFGFELWQAIPFLSTPHPNGPLASASNPLVLVASTRDWLWLSVVCIAYVVEAFVAFACLFAAAKFFPVLYGIYRNRRQRQWVRSNTGLPK